jgi:isopentenyldiphosphate isomerase
MEFTELYDINRQKTGNTLERGQKTPQGEYRLVVHVCIFHPDGRMLIQRRQPFVIGWPGRWDVSMGGNAVVGDTSQTAVQRELREELGIDYDFTDVRPAMTANFPEGFDDFYTLTMELDLADLQLQKEEVCDARWATREEIMEMIDNGLFIPYEKGLIQYLFFLKDHQGCWET